MSSEVERRVTFDTIERDIIEIDLAPEEEQEARAKRLIEMATIGIATDAEAARAVDIVLSARERRDRIYAACKAMMTEADRRVESREGLLMPALEGWAAQKIGGGKQRHVKFATGRVGFRAVPGGALEWEDESAVREWLEVNLPQALNTARTPILKGVVQEHLEHGGALPPTARLAEPRESFYVKPV